MILYREIRKIENFEIFVEFFREMRWNMSKKRSITLLVCVWRSFLEIQIFMKSYLNSVYNLSKSEQNHQKSRFWICRTLKVLKIALKVMKIWISNFFFENLNPELHFGTGFDGIRQLAQFLQHFEIFTQNHGFSRILLLRQK